MPPIATLSRTGLENYRIDPVFAGVKNCDKKILQAATATLDGVRVDPSVVNSYKQAFFDQKAFYTGGTLVQAKQTFFDRAAPVDHLSNWFGVNGLPPDTLFLMTGYSCDIRFGTIPTGTAGNDADAATLPADVTVAPITRANFYQHFLPRGRVNLSIQNRRIINDMIGMDNWPMGRGVAGASSIATTASSTTAAANNYNNGIPHGNNRNEFAPWHVLGPNQALTNSIEQQTAAALTVTGVDAYFYSEVFGFFFELPR